MHAVIAQAYPNGKELYPYALNTTRVNSSPFEKIGEKPLFCYYTLAISSEPISFFTGVSRTFFTAEGRFLSVVSSEVMLVMTVVVTVEARRKTCFPTADAVIATKAEPSEDAIGFLYLTPFCPIASMYIVKVIAWYDTDFAKRYTIISCHAITISHHETGFSMCSGLVWWGGGHL